ncbi:Asp23/Gls24 family envelope stress response protein [Mycobacterium sp. C31M]
MTDTAGQGRLAPRSTASTDGPERVAHPVRGNLTVATRVAQRLAERAALETSRVQSHSRGIDKITGNALPHAAVDVVANVVRARVTIAIDWPSPAVEVAGEVQQRVSEALVEMGGFDVAIVDVTVAHIGCSTTKKGRVL